MDLNNTIVNHVNLTICEITLELFKGGNCSTHAIYCKLFGDKVLMGDLGPTYLYPYVKIVDLLSLIYGFEKIESMCYVDNYFKTRAYLNVEKLVRLTNKVLMQNTPLHGNSRL